MRQVYLVLLAGLIVIGALVLANWRVYLGSSQHDKPIIQLDNLPASYCPSQAEVFHTSSQAVATRLDVVACDVVRLGDLDLANAEEVYVKLPKALAFSIQYSSSVDRYVVGVRVGDATDDNIINEQDEALVMEQIFTDANSADVDLDGQVSSDDLALVKLNEAVGKKRPDGGSWTL